MSAFDFSRPFRTRDGRPVSGVTDEGEYITGFIGKDPHRHYWSPEGLSSGNTGGEHAFDLVQPPTPVKIVRYWPVDRNTDELYMSPEEAGSLGGLVARVEWEE